MMDTMAGRACSFVWEIVALIEEMKKEDKGGKWVRLRAMVEQLCYPQ